MRRTGFALALLAAVAVLGALSGAFSPAGSQGPPPQGGPGGPGAPGRPPGMTMPGAPVDSFMSERDSLAKLVLEKIKGRENAPAESVFKNVKMLKGLPAARLLRAMNGWGHALGVSCRHCHVENHWADEDKKPKAITRGMIEMVDSINDTLLTRVFPNAAADDKPHVGCFTCHRGHANPNAGMGMGRPPGQQGQPGQPGQPPQGAPGH
jgi:hypothetical protein